MALIDRKVNDWSQAVSSLDDKPKMTASDLKAAFDSNSNQLKPAINGIIDDLTGSQGALNIGLTPIDGLSGSNVQAVLQAISLLLKNKDIDIVSLKKLFTSDGASLVGLQPVSGVSASNLQQAIISLADTISKIDPYLGNPVAISQGGTDANDSQNALYNLGARPNDNLYDNWDFTNPINQQGKEIYTGVGYTISRYRCDQSFGSVEIIKGTGVKFKSDGEVTVFSQPCTKEFAENLVGKTFTLSVLLSDGRLFSATKTIEMKAPAININLINDPTIHTNFQVAFFPEQNLYQIFRAEVYQTEIIVDAIKFELGNQQTLARKLDNGLWEKIDHQNYDIELLKCQSYFFKIDSSMYIAGAMYSETEGIFTIPAQKMRISPSIKSKRIERIIDSSGSSLWEENINTVSVLSSTNSGITLKVTTKQPIAVGPAVLVNFICELSAEL